MKIDAEARAFAKFAEAEAEIRAHEKLLEIAKHCSELYANYPAVLQYDLALATCQCASSVPT